MPVDLSSKSHVLCTISGTDEVLGSAKVCKWGEAYNSKDKRVVVAVSYHNPRTHKQVEFVKVYKDIEVAVRAIEKLRKRLAAKPSLLKRGARSVRKWFARKPSQPVAEAEPTAKTSAVEPVKTSPPVQSLNALVHEVAESPTQSVSVLEAAEASKTKVQQKTRQKLTISL